MSNPPQEKTITLKKLICSGRQMSNFSTFEVWLHAVNRIRKQSKQDSKLRSWNENVCPLILEIFLYCVGFYLFFFRILHSFYGCRSSLIYFKSISSKELSMYLAMMKAFDFWVFTLNSFSINKCLLNGYFYQHCSRCLGYILEQKPKATSFIIK